MSPTLITVIGFAAAIGTTAAWLPQVLKTWTSRRATDFSWGYLRLFSAGVFLWFVYGILRNDLAIIIANGVTLLLVLVVAVVKFREQ